MVICRKTDDCKAYPTAQNTVRLAIDRSESERVEVCFNYFPAGCDAREHVHTGREQVYYVVSGTGTVCINGENARIEPGMIVYVPRGAKHSTKADPEQDLMYVVFNAFSPDATELASKTFAEHYKKIVKECQEDATKKIKCREGEQT